jgi:hypothetical protein
VKGDVKINAIYGNAALVLGLIYGAFFFLLVLDSIPLQWKRKTSD